MSTEYAKRVTPMGIPNTRLDDLPDLIDESCWLSLL